MVTLTIYPIQAMLKDLEQTIQKTAKKTRLVAWLSFCIRRKQSTKYRAQVKVTNNIKVSKRKALNNCLY